MRKLGNTINISFKAQSDNTLNIFWIGFTLYTFGFLFPNTGLISYVLGNIFQVFGILFFLYSVPKLIYVSENILYLRALIIFYLVWSLFVISKGFHLDYVIIKALLFEPSNGVLMFFAPIFAFFKINKLHIRLVFKVIILFGIGYLTLMLFFYKTTLTPNVDDYNTLTVIEIFSKTLGLPCGFLLITYNYKLNKNLFLIIFVMTLAIFSAVVNARRGLTFMAVSILCASYLVFLFKNKRNMVAFIVFGFFLLGIGVIVLYSIQDSQLGIFQSIANRIDEDSRSPVEYCFYNDMSTKDWIIGKGINGQYFCPGVDAPDSIYRSGIESDYLNIILKGGLISLITLLIIVVPAIFVGLFRSKNFMTKGCAIWLILWVIYLYPATVVTFNLHYLLVWFSIAVCYSKQFRNISEREMQVYLA